VGSVLSRTRSRRAAAQRQLGQLEGTLGAGIEVLRERGQTAVEALAPRLESARETLAPRLETAVGTAKEVAGQALTDAGEWAAPRIGIAREQAVTTVREKVAPKVTQAIANAAEASKPARKEAKNRADAALAALRGEVGPPKRKRRWHRMSFLLGAGAVSGALVALVVRRKEPSYGGYEPFGAGDPYARPTGTSTPPAPPAEISRPISRPISSMEDEIAGTLHPAAGNPIEQALPTSSTTAQPAESADSPGSAGNGEIAAQIDVTEPPVDAADASGGRHRKRTRRGQPE
jgi:hypothetical protein